MAEMRSGRPASGRFLLAAVVLAAAVCGAPACSGRQGALSAAGREYARGNCGEALVICEDALRGGRRDAGILRVQGLALLCLDRDAEALEALREAAAAEPALAAGIASDLAAQARQALAGGRTGPAGGRMRAAAEIDPRVETRELAYLVADGYYGEGRWADAARWYREALAARPDTSAAEKALFRLATSWLAEGDSAAAVAAFEEQLDKFPRGEASSEARWSLAGVLHGLGRSEFERGNFDAAVALARAAIGRAGGGVAEQKARFLMGESFERMGDYGAAYEQYEAIVGADPGASGRIVQISKARMAAMREAGLR